MFLLLSLSSSLLLLVLGTRSLWWKRPWSTRNSSMRSSMGRLLSRASGGNGNGWNFQLLLLRCGLLLPYPLHRHGQTLYLLHQGGEQSLLVCRWWGWRVMASSLGEELFTARRAPDATGGGNLGSSLHHAFKTPKSFHPLPCALICCSWIPTRTPMVPEGLLAFFGGMRTCFLASLDANLQGQSRLIGGYLQWTLRCLSQWRRMDYSSGAKSNGERLNECFVGSSEMYLIGGPLLPIYSYSG